MEQDRDLTGATVYRTAGYAGARWHALPDGEVVLQRPSGELDRSILSADDLASKPMWRQENESDDPAQQPAEQN